MDKVREKKRQEALSQGQVEKVATERAKAKEVRVATKEKTTSWSDKLKQREVRDLRRDKKKRKKAWEKTADAEPTPAVAEDELSDGEDWNELQREERIVKKVKKGHVSDTQFSAEFSEL